MAEPRTNVAQQAAIAGDSAAAARRLLGLPRWELFTLGVWFVVFTCLAEYFPRTGDDWAWGTQEGLNRLPGFFQGVNGRYGGDLAILGLMRVGPLAAIVEAAVVVATLFLVLHIAGNRTPVGYALVAAAFLVMPRGTWREAVVWLSGFVNYGIASLVFLAFLAVAQAEWHGRLARVTTVRLGWVALAGFVGQFFMEHVSICICAVGVLFTVVHRRGKGRWPAYLTTWTVAAIVGAGVMLANPAYRRAASSTAGYQKLQVTSGPHAFHNLLVKTFDYLPTQTVVSNIIFNGALAVALVVLVAVSGRWSSRAGKIIVALSVAFLAVTWALSYLERDSRHLREHTRAFATVAALLMLAALVLTALTAVQSAQRRWTMLTACVALVCMVGPLILVNPVGPRCFLPTYVVLLVALSLVAAEIREQAPAASKILVWTPINLAAIGFIAYFFVVYVSIHNAIDHRLTHVREAVRAGATTVQIAPLPYSYYVHNGDPFWSVLQKRFKAYYGVPQSVKVQLTPNLWLKTPGKHSLPAP